MACEHVPDEMVLSMEINAPKPMTASLRKEREREKLKIV
jgi:hypothetical protein